MEHFNYNDDKNNANSLQFYTMNKLKQGDNIEFINNYDQAFSNNSVNNSINQINYNHKTNYSIYNTNDGDNLNIPRKSPFNLNEVNIQNDKTAVNNDSFNSNNIPLGPMSLGIVDQKTKNNSSFNSIESQRSGKPLGSLASIISLINPSLFWSDNTNSSSAGNTHNVNNNDDDYEDMLNEPPLLEELGIDPTNIIKYMKCVVLFKSINNDNLEWDMAGPILLIGCLGFFLLLAGKIHFGYIYGIGILSCIGTYILLNIMSNNQSIDLYTTMSILGYSLLPIVILAGISVLFSLRTKIGIIMAIFFNMWSTITASRFFEYTVSLKHQRYLIAYPIALLYASFTIVTIF